MNTWSSFSHAKQRRIIWHGRLQNFKKWISTPSVVNALLLSYVCFSTVKDGCPKTFAEWGMFLSTAVIPGTFVLLSGLQAIAKRLR